jgi:hypothetical protein
MRESLLTKELNKLNIKNEVKSEL